MYFLVFALILAILFIWPAPLMFLAAITYVSSGPLIRLWTIAFPSRRAEPGTEPAEVDDFDETVP